LSLTQDGRTTYTEIIRTERVLHKTIGNKSLTEKQLVTVLTEIEAILNACPLVYVDRSVNSHSVVIPASFLSLSTRHILPDYNSDVDSEFVVTKRISTSQRLLFQTCGVRKTKLSREIFVQ